MATVIVIVPALVQERAGGHRLLDHAILALLVIRPAPAHATDANWRKHTLAHLDADGTVTPLLPGRFTPEPLVKEEDGGISLAKIAPKARVY